MKALKFYFISFAVLVTGCGTLSVGNSERSVVIERLWSQELPLDDKLGAERFHGMSPLIVGEVIYQGNGKDGFAAYSKQSGSPLWRRIFENGVTGGAAYREGKLYLGASDGQFYCLNASDGSTIWSFPVRSEVLATPFVSQDGTVYFTTANNVIYALDAENGKQRWLYNRTDTTTFSIRGGATPIQYKDRILIGFTDGFFVALNAKTGALVWERNLNKNAKFKDINATAVLENNSVYISSYDDSLYKLSADDGQINWRVEKGGYVPVTIAGTTIYHATSDGELLSIEKDTGKINWTYKVSKGVATQAVLFNELLVFGESRGNLQILNAADGKTVTNFVTGRGQPSSPVIDSKTGEIFLVSNQGNLFALKLYWEKKSLKLPWEKSL